MYFDVCWPPNSASCFDPYIEDCGFVAIAANFTSDQTEICQYDVVNFTDNSTGDITSWNWTFEGGDPATSTEQNPVVTYNETGMFDVELEVSDGANSNSLFSEDYISVELTPPIMLLSFEDVCDTDPSFELTGGSPAGGVYSGPGVGNGWFDPVTAGIGLHTIIYTFTAGNGCDNSAEETILVDECTGLAEKSNEKIQLYPNPTSGEFELIINHNGILKVQLFNILGMEIYQFQGMSNGFIHQKVDIGNFESGIYFVILTTEKESVVKKIKLVKP